MASKKYTVSEYMHKEVVTINEKATVKDALALMIHRGTNGLVVVDESQGVKGILSSRDLIDHVIPDYLEDDKHLASFEAANVLEERAKKVANDPIAGLIKREVKTIHPDRSLMEAAALLAEFKIRQLPVVDADGKLVGYLNRTDIKKALGEILGV